MSKDDRLMEIAAILVEAAIRPDDQRPLQVTLTFEAKRSDVGVWISGVTLGYDQPRKKGP